MQLNETLIGMSTAAWTNMLIDTSVHSLHDRTRDERVALMLALTVGGGIGM